MHACEGVHCNRSQNGRSRCRFLIVFQCSPSFERCARCIKRAHTCTTAVGYSDRGGIKHIQNVSDFLQIFINRNPCLFASRTSPLKIFSSLSFSYLFILNRLTQHSSTFCTLVSILTQRVDMPSRSLPFTVPLAPVANVAGQPGFVTNQSHASFF